MKFEEALAELEKLLKKMENGQTALDELLTDYEKAMKLLNFCRSQLAGFERKIEILKQDDGKTGEWANFNADETKEAPASSRKSTYVEPTEETKAAEGEEEFAPKGAEKDIEISDSGEMHDSDELPF